MTEGPDDRFLLPLDDLDAVARDLEAIPRPLPRRIDADPETPGLPTEVAVTVAVLVPLAPTVTLAQTAADAPGATAGVVVAGVVQVESKNATDWSREIFDGSRPRRFRRVHKSLENHARADRIVERASRSRAGREPSPSGTGRGFDRRYQPR